MDLSLVKQCCSPGWVMCSDPPCPLSPASRTGSCSAAATRTTSRLSNTPLVLSSKPQTTDLCLPCFVSKSGLAETSEYLLQLPMVDCSSDPEEILLCLSLQPGWVLPSTCWWSEQCKRLNLALTAEIPAARSLNPSEGDKQSPLESNVNLCFI